MITVYTLPVELHGKTIIDSEPITVVSTMVECEIGRALSADVIAAPPDEAYWRVPKHSDWYPLPPFDYYEFRRVRCTLAPAGLATIDDLVYVWLRIV